MVVSGARRLGETEIGDGSGWPSIVWVQDTDIGVDLITDHRDLAVWTTDLRSGKPLAGVEVGLLGIDATLVTDDNGLGRTSLDSRDLRWVVASLGPDQVLYDMGRYSNISFWPQNDRTIWYAADDRGIYRPGETLHLKGWVRNLDFSGDGDLELFPTGELIHYRAYGPLGNDLKSGEVRLDDHGGFDLTVELGEGENLGWGRIEFRRSADTDQYSYVHSFQIQEFRRPEFEVEARLESTSPVLVDQPAVVSVDAQYFSGGPLPNAEVNWRSQRGGRRTPRPIGVISPSAYGSRGGTTTTKIGPGRQAQALAPMIVGLLRGRRPFSERPTAAVPIICTWILRAMATTSPRR